jgi:hypothetical protein
MSDLLPFVSRPRTTGAEEGNRIPSRAQRCSLLDAPSLLKEVRVLSKTIPPAKAAQIIDGVNTVEAMLHCQ